MRHIIPQPPTKGKFSKKCVTCKQNCGGVSFKYVITPTPPHSKMKRVIAVTETQERRQTT